MPTKSPFVSGDFFWGYVQMGEGGNRFFLDQHSPPPKQRGGILANRNSVFWNFWAGLLRRLLKNPGGSSLKVSKNWIGWVPPLSVLGGGDGGGGCVGPKKFDCPPLPFGGGSFRDTSRLHSSLAPMIGPWIVNAIRPKCDMNLHELIYLAYILFPMFSPKFIFDPKISDNFFGQKYYLAEHISRFLMIKTWNYFARYFKLPCGPKDLCDIFLYQIGIGWKHWHPQTFPVFLDRVFPWWL